MMMMMMITIIIITIIIIQFRCLLTCCVSRPVTNDRNRAAYKY